MTPAHTLVELMQLFDFTDDDLEANRAGHLSERQRARIEAERLTASIEKASATMALCVFVIATILFLSAAFPMGQAMGPWILVAIVIWVLLATGAESLAQGLSRGWLRHAAHDRNHWLLRRLGRLNRAGDERVREGLVERLTGLLTHSTNEEHRTIMLDGEPFQSDVASGELDERLWQLATGLQYAFYLVPDVLWMLSAEPLD